jgi:hypothetical protein
MIRWDEPDDVVDEDVVEETDEWDEFEEGEWELDPNDPTHPDHDLSESASYMWEPPAKPIFLRRGFLLVVSALVIVGLMLPALARIF